MTTLPPTMQPPPRKLITRKRLVAAGVQLALFAGLVWLLHAIAQNVIANLQARHIASGFGFMEQPAGFAISQTLIAYSEASSYGRASLVGLLNTLLVAAISVVLATALGLFIGVARLSRNWLVAHLAAAYVEILRNIPLLLQLFFWYFAVLRQLPGPRQSVNIADSVFLNNRGLFIPEAGLGNVGAFALGGACVALGLLVRAAPFLHGQGRRALGAGLIVGGIALFPAGLAWEPARLQGFNFQGGVRVLPELVSLVLALTLYSAAYIAEIVRAGIQSVPRGQVEAARAIGLSGFDAMRFVILPQALRLIVPPLTNQYLTLTKNSAYAVAIAYPDLVSVFTGIVLAQTGQAVEILALTMAVYLVISLITAAILAMFNARYFRTAGARA
jgi:general L-amino acid transport system permease protein